MDLRLCPKDSGLGDCGIAGAATALACIWTGRSKRPSARRAGCSSRRTRIGRRCVPSASTNVKLCPSTTLRLAPTCVGRSWIALFVGCDPAASCSLVCGGFCRGGQQWTTHSQLQNGPFMNKWTKYEPGLYAFNTEPKVGIGQRAFLVQTARQPFSTFSLSVCLSLFQRVGFQNLTIRHSVLCFVPRNY